MDHVVDDHGGLEVNLAVGAKRSKSCKNTSLNKAFASPRKLKSRTSSNESEYEVVAELDNDESENGPFSDYSEDDSDENDNSELNENNTSTRIKPTEISDPSESVEMDEVFVIVDDDANETPDENIETREASREKIQCLSDGDDFEMDEIIAEFAEQEKKNVPRLSDNEDEMDSILDAFAETQCNESTDEKNSDANIILSSEGEDEMEGLLEEFSKENISEEDSSTAEPKSHNKDISPVNQIGKSSDSIVDVCDIKKENLCDTSNQFKPVTNLINQPRNEQHSSNFQNHTIDTSTDKGSISAKSECVIVCDTDERSNISNCSSVEILLDDDVKDVNKNTLVKEEDKISCEIRDCVANDSPAFSFSDGENNELDKMILDIVDADTDDANSNTNLTNIFDTHVSKTPASVTETSEKSIISSMERLSKAVEVNSETQTNTPIKNSECSKENIPVNDASSEFGPLSLNKFICDAESHSTAIPKTVDDQNVFSNSVEISGIAEGDTQSRTNERITSKIKTDVEISDNVVEGNVSPCATEEVDIEKTIQGDKNKSLEDGTSDIGLKETSIKNATEDGSESKSLEDDGKSDIILKDTPIKNATQDGPEDDNDISTDKLPMTLESSLESEVTNSHQSDDKKDETLKTESKSDEEKKITLDTEDNCAADFKTKEDCSGTTEPCTTEDVNVNTDSIIPSSISKDLPLTAGNTNKRKLEENSDAGAKKFRKVNEENDDSNYLNGEESSASSTSGDFGLKNTNIEELVSDVTVADYKAVDKINSLIPWNPSEKIETTKTVLDRIAMYVCQEVVKESFKKKYLDENNKVKELEDKIEVLSKNLDAFRLQFADFRDTQKIAFAEQNFKAKLQTRTVGVNVKIYRESEIKQVLSMQSTLKNKTTLSLENTTVKEEKPVLEPKTETSPVKSNIKAANPAPPQLLLPNAQLKDTVFTPVLTPQQANIRRQLLPRIIANRPLVGAQIMSGLQQRIPPPNVTVSGNQLIPLVSSRSRTPSTHSVVLVPSSTITSSSRNSLVDLTKEEHARNAANGTTNPTTTVAKVTVPGMPNNPNVLVPLRDYLQLLPPGAKGPPVIQPSPVSRPAVIPQLPSGLLGARTVTYIVPQNSGFAGRGIPQFVSPPNQQVQFVLRVTTPGSVPSFSPVVNTISRPATMPQPQVTTAPRTSSGLILFSHTTKHPAPFPKSPHYPDTKGKAIPPKPSLKGSKNSNGIVLSWNMCLLRHHANISSYQLFAYQETDGPVDSSLWKKVGDVNALPLPMACTLTQFVDKNRYYFTVRAVDTYQRYGPFSDPVSILYDKEGDSSSKK